jgi:arylsulfatase A-like enzyme
MGSGEESIAGDEGHRSVPSKFALSRRSLCIVVLFLLGACVPDPADEPRRRVTGPNILVIITDDQRATSTLEEMPQARRWLSRSGIRFTNAYATTPLCCPSRASIYTGRYAHNHGVETNLSPDVHRLDHSSTLQRYLQEAGYRTAIVGKFLNRWPIAEAPPYFDSWSIFTTGVPYFRGTWNVEGEVSEITTYSTTYIGDRATDFLRQAETDDDRPWFLNLATAAPHQPSIPEHRYADLAVPSFDVSPSVGEKDRSDKPPYVRSGRVPLSVVRKVRREQIRSLPSVDDMIGRVRSELEALGEEDTLTIFLSDNGMMWGEHGLHGKTAPYVDSVKIPMLLNWPGHVAPGIDERLVANIDVAPTVLDAVGITTEPAVDGRSLLDGRRRRSLLLEYWDMFRYETPTWAALLSEKKEYIEYYNERGATTFVEYYDLAADPWQLKNAGAGKALDGWSRRLVKARTCKGASCP